MELSKRERLILANQFEILAALYPELKEEYCKKKEMVETGYPLELENMFDGVLENKMERTECLEVREILTMYNDIQWSYENLNNSDKKKIDDGKINFRGFDPHESEHYNYADFHLRTGVLSKDFLPKRSGDLNTHEPVLSKYRKMLTNWKSISDRKPKNLTAEQINSLIN